MSILEYLFRKCFFSYEELTPLEDEVLFCHLRHIQKDEYRKLPEKIKEEKYRKMVWKRT